MRPATALLLLFVAAGCGSGASPPTTRAPVSSKVGPPAAWIETQTGRTRLGFSSYCWRSGNSGVCADALAPRCGLKGIPNVAVSEGETVRAHLGYDVDEASIEGARTELEGRVASWRVASNGPFLLFTKGKDGDASYVACAVIH